MAMTENPEALPLEQKCLYPGRWLIEGYDVKRRTGRRAVKWPSEWHIVRPGQPDIIRRTLGEIRDLIRAGDARLWGGRRAVKIKEKPR